MYDCIIVGSGPAGISASLYLKRANKKICILSKGEGALSKAEKIENYYGLENPISGKELHQIGEKQARDLQVPIIREEVVNIQKTDRFLVETQNNVYEGRNVILATGAPRKKLSVKGIEALEGRGVSYCAICDAFFFRGKTVVVVGSGNYAIHELKELKPVVDKVILCTNGEKLVENRDEDLEDVSIQTAPIYEVRGKEKVEEVILEDGTDLPVEGVFIALGTATSQDLALKLGAYLQKNDIVVDENKKTNVEGLYACGDCTGGMLQIAKAVNDGMVAALDIIRKDSIHNNARIC